MSERELTLDKLGTVSRGRSRHRPRDADFLYGGPYPLVQTGDVKRAGLYLRDYEQTYSEAGLAQSKLWPVGTLCITIAANIAETSILDTEACFPDSVIGFVADKEKADTRFVKYLFDAVLKVQFQSFTQGAAQDNLSQSKLLSIKFPVPELPHQEKIADILSAYDDLIENNRRRIAVLEEAARLLYREWFVHFRFPGHEHIAVTDSIPEGWERTTYSALFNLLCGFAFKSKTYLVEGKFGIVTIKNVHEAQFIPECLSRLDDVPEQMQEHCALATGDILLSLTGNVGRACIVFGENYLLNQRVAKVVVNTGVPRSFTYWTFSNGTTQKELDNLAYGVAQLNLSPIKLGKREFLRPSPMVLDLFGKMADPMFQLITNLNLEIVQLSHARDLLLPRLMNGEVAV